MTAPIVFVHPSWWGGDYWGTVLSAMGGSVSASAPDLPGHGSRPGPFTAEGAVRALAEHIGEGGTPVDLVGLSLGARVSLVTAARHPELVRSTVLLGIGDDVSRAASVVQRLALRLIGPAAARRIGGTASVQSAIHAARALPGLGVRESAQRVSAPTLVVAGGADREFTPGCQRVADLMPNAVLQTVPDAEHLWPRDRPHDFVELLTAWRRDLAAEEAAPSTETP